MLTDICLELLKVKASIWKLTVKQRDSSFRVNQCLDVSVCVCACTHIHVYKNYIPNSNDYMGTKGENELNESYKTLEPDHNCLLQKSSRIYTAALITQIVKVPEFQ